MPSFGADSVRLLEDALRWWSADLFTPQELARDRAASEALVRASSRVFDMSRWHISIQFGAWKRRNGQGHLSNWHISMSVSRMEATRAPGTSVIYPCLSKRRKQSIVFATMVTSSSYIFRLQTPTASQQLPRQSQHRH